MAVFFGEKYDSIVMEQADKITGGTDNEIMDNPALTSVNPFVDRSQRFQFLMPPIQYLSAVYRKIGRPQCIRIWKKDRSASLISSYVIQAHIPVYCTGDLVNVYPLFEIRLPSHWLWAIGVR